jgi:hypothetical protein
MPCGARAGLESGAGGLNERRIGARISGTMRTVPMKHSDGPFPEGCKPTLLIFMAMFPRLKLPGMDRFNVRPVSANSPDSGRLAQ